MQLNSLSHTQLERLFGSTTFLRGCDYVARGKVLELRHHRDLIESVVAGSSGARYRQRIRLSEVAGKLQVAGHCTCPMQFNCKHVAATVILARQDGGSPVPPGLSHRVQDWLDRMQGFAQRSATPAPVTAAAKRKFEHFIAFVLAPGTDGALRLHIGNGRMLLNGTLDKVTRVAYAYDLLNNAPANASIRDRQLISLVLGMMKGGAYGAPMAELAGPDGGMLMGQLLEQGRLLLAPAPLVSKFGELAWLKPGAPRTLSLGWQAGTQDGLRVAWQFEDGQAIDYLVPTDPPYYVQGLEVGLLHPQASLAGRDLAALAPLVRAAPEVAQGEVETLSLAMRKCGLDGILPLPAELTRQVRTGIRPVPVLRLYSEHEAGAAGAASMVDYVEFDFEYDGLRLIDFAAAEAPSRKVAGGIEVIKRDNAGERRALRRLEQAGFYLENEDSVGLGWLPSTADWLAFVRQDMPRLMQAGWKIEFDASFRFDLAEVEDWYAELVEDQANPYFELELGIIINGAKVSLLPVLLELIRAAPAQFEPAAVATHDDAEELLVALAGGSSVALPWGRLKPILAAVGELYFADYDGAPPRLQEIDAARLAMLEANAMLRWMGGERLLGIGRKLANFDGIAPVAAPSGLQGQLRPYQQQGLAWMQFLREYGMAGILADDMGLGKTLQTLAHILTEKESGRLDLPALVVAPTSLMGNWQAEAARFAPALRVVVLQGAGRAGLFEQIAQADLVLTTYALLPRDEELLKAQRFHLLVLDESQYIKNSRAKVSQAALLLAARHRLCLTGTPVQNHLGELWSQFQFLLPGLLGDEKRFNAHYRKPIEQQGDQQRKDFLTSRIKPFMLRRTKDMVAKELPPKTEIVRQVELAGAQRDLYETVRLAMDSKVREAVARKGVARSQIVILDALLKLRQVCCDPRLVKAGARKAAGSAKLAELTGMLDELLDEGRRILVFSQFTSMLALIEEELRQRAISYALLTGDSNDRDAQVARFQRGEAAVFLISLKAGGVGLNLTAADTVIHYDPWWNPAAENQATDRAWRIGQDKPVFVYKLIAKGTLEERIQDLQRRKAALADAILGAGEAATGQVTAEDLQAIFAPI